MSLWRRLRRRKRWTTGARYSDAGGVVAPLREGRVRVLSAIEQKKNIFLPCYATRGIMAKLEMVRLASPRLKLWLALLEQTKHGNGEDGFITLRNMWF